MEWNSEDVNEKKGMNLSSKILLAIIVCVFLIIVLVLILIMNTDQATYTILVDQKAVADINGTLLKKVDDSIYINIEEFAKLVNYEYHKGEYKTFTVEDTKCYVQGKEETASFYLNDNKVFKLPLNKLTEDYRDYTTEKPIKSIDGKMYAPLDAIKIAFNVAIKENQKGINITTLNYLVTLLDEKVQRWGFTSISEQDFENKKAILYDYLIVKKENGLYKIIDTQNTKEIVSDRYSAIQFTEYTQEFFVTNSLGQVGIINLDGTTAIEPVYESINLLNKEKELYIVQKDKLYGVLKRGNITILYPEYDQIGCIVTTVDLKGSKKTVKPATFVEECNGIIVKKANKYGLINIEGKELVPIAVESFYKVEDTYYMLYNGEELNVIERLKAAGLIKDKESNSKTTTQLTNTTSNIETNTLQGNVASSTITNTSINAIQNQVID